eukprot:4706619-Pleurochrysis_carterae.AAC.5
MRRGTHRHGGGALRAGGPTRRASLCLRGARAASGALAREGRRARARTAATSRARRRAAARSPRRAARAPRAATGASRGSTWKRRARDGDNTTLTFQPPKKGEGESASTHRHESSRLLTLVHGAKTPRPKLRCRSQVMDSQHICLHWLPAPPNRRLPCPLSVPFFPDIIPQSLSHPPLH